MSRTFDGAWELMQVEDGSSSPEGVEMRAGDGADFAEFVEGTAGRLFRSAYAVCGDRALAEDAVQAALMSAYLSWRRIRQADSPEAYVRRMVINQVLGWRRRKRFRQETPRAEVPESSVASHETRVVETDMVWHALLALPARQRAVIVLRYYEDLSEIEIAEALGIRPGTVKSQTSSALAHLRRELGQNQPVIEEMR